MTKTKYEICCNYLIESELDNDKVKINSTMFIIVSQIKLFCLLRTFIKQ